LKYFFALLIGIIALVIRVLFAIFGDF